MYWDMFGNMNYKIEDLDFRVSNIITSTIITFSEDYLEKVDIGQAKPEEVAFDLYDSTEYFWVILVANNIVNPFNDWVMNNEELVSFAISKYGEANLKKAHHYLDINGREFDFDTSNIIRELIDDFQPVPFQYKAVTNFEYEAEVNGKKSVIWTVPKRNLFAFIDMYQSAVRALSPVSN